MLSPHSDLRRCSLGRDLTCTTTTASSWAKKNTGRSQAYHLRYLLCPLQAPQPPHRLLLASRLEPQPLSLTILTSASFTSVVLPPTLSNTTNHQVSTTQIPSQRPHLRRRRLTLCSMLGARSSPCFVCLCMNTPG